MVREEGVRLDIERELLRRALDPEHGVLLGGWEVVRRVDLDDRELLGVELQTSLSGLRRRRVEMALFHEGRLGPARDPDEDVAHLVERNLPAFLSFLTCARTVSQDSADLPEAKMSESTRRTHELVEWPRSSGPPQLEPASLRAFEWVASMAILALLLATLVISHPHLHVSALEILLWLLVVVLSDLLAGPVSQGLNLAMSLPVLLAAAMVYAPPVAGLLAFVGTIDPRELKREINLPHALFNRGQIALSCFTASLVFHALGGNLKLWPHVIAAALVAICADILVNWSMIILASNVARSHTTRSVLRSLTLEESPWFVLTYVAFALAAVLLATEFVFVGRTALVIAAIPIFLAWQVFAKASKLSEMAQAIDEKARALILLSERISDERRDERLTLAACLHDDVMPPLQQLSLMGQVVRQDLATGQLLALEEDVPSLVYATEEAARAMRERIRDLRTSPLGPGGLVQTLELLVRTLQEDATAEIHLEAAEVGGSPVVQLLAYQIVREAIRNSIRHARARRIDVSLVREESDMRLRIHDDGAGFDEATVDRTSHFGLQLIRDRVELAGGALYLSSQPGNGTELVIRLPAEISV
jgi:signal transduction histidine kinase